MISPSAGMISPASTTITSPRCSSGAGTASSRRASAAFVVVRVARSALACALPRPSAIASAKFAKSTVSQSQIAIVATNQRLPVWPRASSSTKIPVVITLPSSTMNMTGFVHCRRGSSFGNESRIAASTSSREKTLPRARGHHCTSEAVESEVELEHVDAGLAEEAEAAAVRVRSRSASARWRAAGAGRRRRASTAAARMAARCRGRCPEPEVVTASTGMSWIVRPGLYGRSSFRIAWPRRRRRSSRDRGSSGRGSRRSSRRRCRRATSRTVARGSTSRSVNSCAASREPTTLPSIVIRLPFAWSLNATCANPVIRAG